MLVAVAVGHECAGFLHPFGAWWDLVRLAWFVFLASLLGFFLALFPGWFVVGPLLYDREIKNGGPFKIGDTVQVLSGPHRGRITRVYATWQHGALRVELGPKEKEEFTDVLAPVRLLRAEPSAPNGSPAERLDNSAAGGGPPSVGKR